MDAPGAITLNDLLEETFEKPDVGTVNLKLLYNFLRSLIVGLKIGDLVVSDDPSSQSGTSSASATPDANGSGNVEPSDADSASKTNGSSSSENKSIILSTENGSTETGTATTSRDISSAEVSQIKEQYAEIMDLLKAYLVRLMALEKDVDTIKARRMETLEILSKILENIDQLESRLCEEQKKLAKLMADFECLSLLVGQYESNFEQFYRRLDSMDVEIRTIKCTIRCIEKEREQFTQAVQTVTEQINHFSLTKADKTDVERELGLRAYATDLKNYVPCDCFNVIQAEVTRSIALLHEDDFNQQSAVRTKFYELEKLLQRKSDVEDLETMRKQIMKVIQGLKQLEHQLQSKSRYSSVSAGVVSKNNGWRNCLACGDHATLDICYDPVPQARRLIPMGKTRDIFTIRKRNAGGSHTKIAVEERLIKSAPITVLDIPSKDLPGKCQGQMKQIAGDDGCWYLADQETQV